MKIIKVLLVLSLLAIGLLFASGEVNAGDMSLQSGPMSMEGQTALMSPGGAINQSQNSIISPSSSFVLYGRNDGTSWLKDAGGERMVLDGQQPRLSPDGRYIAVRRYDILQGDLFVYDLETEQATQIFTSTDYTVGYSWLSDSNRIYFDYGTDIYAIDRNGSNQQLILPYWPPDDPDGHGGFNDAPDVNPVDGSIAWHNEWHGIGLAMGDGQNPHWLNNSLPGDYSPRWSPDGEWIVFIRWSSGNLYKIRPDGTDLTQLTFLLEPDTMSFWSGAWEAGGKWLIAPATVNEVNRLSIVATDGSGLLTWFYTLPGADPVYVGNAGIWDFRFLYLPLVGR